MEVELTERDLGKLTQATKTWKWGIGATSRLAAKGYSVVRGNPRQELGFTIEALLDAGCLTYAIAQVV